ncbi:uncharacterized protein LOC110856166 isoform X3 [Folsomia candida]|uniref:uncharacterized protein LOC110856166 isoform X3 n=1 Tax=Folsomia candida TaxID=158441 RepID=UPI001604F373|nr:uncharacterized protein LOC110856166 isoform X3 [Folsomia candida]
MSTVAGMFFMQNPGTTPGGGTTGRGIPPNSGGEECPETENINQESDEDNTSCSASEIGCDLSLSASNNNNKSPDSHVHSSSSRKNKRKNFKPRNILEYAGSDEEQEHHHHNNRPQLSKYHKPSRQYASSQQRHGHEMNCDEEENENPRSPSESSIPEKVNGVDLRMDLDGMGNNEEEESGESEDNSEEDNNHGSSHIDGPLDLRDYSSKSWHQSSHSSSKEKEALAVRSLLSNLNNNVNDPASFLNHSFAAAAAAVSNNIPLGLGMGMDLRMAGHRSEQHYDEARGTGDVLPSSTTNPSGGSHLNNNNISAHNNNNNHHPSAAVLNDFAENTMKELLSLYGITDGHRQGGKVSSDLLHGNLDTPPGQSKMMLPENMARFLAAMQESVVSAAAGDHSTQSSQSSVTSNSKSNNPLNFANISSLVQPPSGGSPVRSPSTNGSYSNHSSGLGGLHPQGQQQHHHHHHGRDNGNGNGHLFSQHNKHKSRGLAAFPVIREGLLGKGAGPIDYTRYVRRFGNSMECGYQQCRELNYREHFHCQECSDGTRVFVKKEEMIRHFKWHKKRDESLQHGFMRYSPMDDCSEKFPNCSHNRKQTHYHCLKDACEKVYISTSDVQMHANYHRKDSAIIQEGFQRFRAAEDCGTDNCTFRHQKTTHFHCRRPTCSFTFKNKADMEKHKSYHIKDEQLNRDGFKKFMKHEECLFANCRFSRVCNHIHCIREGCNYVLHSSGQLYSHKRKHERRDAELAYRKYKLAQSLMKGSFTGDLSTLSFSDSFLANKSEEENSRSSFNESGGGGGGGEGGESEDRMVSYKKVIQMCNCDVTQQEHFHCKVDTCLNALLGSVDVAAEHFKNHEMEDKISSLAYFTVDPANFDAQDSTIPCISAKCPYQTREKHYHCLWDGCSEIILVTDEPFKRLEHFRTHQLAPKMDYGDKEGEAMDGFFRRKRGRPPKNRVIEVSSGGNEAIYTSFKLPKQTPNIGNGDGSDSDSKDPIGFLSYPEDVNCNNDACPYQRSSDKESPSKCHYHCNHPRCHFSVSDLHKLSNHLREFHSACDVVEGFKYFDKSWDCEVRKCNFNGAVDHFHCVRDSFSCSKQSEMMNHEADFHEGRSGTPSSEDESESNKPSTAQVVKSSGTFYPTYSLDKSKITSNGGTVMDLSGSNGIPETNESKSVTDHSLSRILQIPSPDNGETQYGPEIACGRPFCKLKRKHHFHCHLCNQAFSELEKLRPHVLKHSHVSPLKAPESDHSDEDSVKNELNEDNHEPEKGSSKIRGDEQFPQFDMGPNPFPPTSLASFLGYPGPPSPYLFLQQNQLTSLYAGMMFGGSPGGVFSHGGVIPPPPSMANPGGIPPHLGGTPPAILPPAEPMVMPSSSPMQLCSQTSKRPSSASPSSPSSPSEAKKARMQMRILKDEPVPEGYIRFRFNEDCQYVHCGYREHQTHFHCTREDCGYSFCDKTRFVQHTARHERLDTLMGGDFKQFRANVSCGRPDCSYKTPPGTTQAQNKASHFHCSKCEFVCTDTNKVVAHRRQHQKLDSIMAAGFEKFTPSQNCQVGKNKIQECIHSQKQTHYHCLKCGYAVLGLSQMSSHKYRHLTD